MLSNHCACGCRLVDLARKRQILAILAGKRLIITRNHWTTCNWPGQLRRAAAGQSSESPPSQAPPPAGHPVTSSNWMKPPPRPQWHSRVRMCPKKGNSGTFVKITIFNVSSKVSALVKHPTSMHVIDQRDNLLYSCGNLLYDTTSSTVHLLTPRGARGFQCFKRVLRAGELGQLPRPHDNQQWCGRAQEIRYGQRGRNLRVYQRWVNDFHF